MNAVVEDIWKMLHEIAKSQKEHALRFNETDLWINENELKNAEFEVRNKAIEAKHKEMDAKLIEADIRLKETNAQLSAEIKKVNAMIGRLGSKLGDYVEEMVRPAAVRLFRERGIDVHEVHQNVKSQRGDEGIEIDLLVVNDTDIIAIECKSTLSIDDVNAHLERLAKLKRLLPSYANKRVLGAVTGMVIPDNVASYAYTKGLFVIAQSGEHLLIRNDADFLPESW